MADEREESHSMAGDDTGHAASTVAEPAQKPARKPAPAKPGLLPPYKVLLHNDDVNDMGHVVLSILKVISLSLEEAENKTLEAHRSGVTLLVVTHKERAELYEEQFRTFGLTVTIEPDA